ncbi:MAG: hypothetical protein AAF355_11135 [Myxococcota bacterium]
MALAVGICGAMRMLGSWKRFAPGEAGLFLESGARSAQISANLKSGLASSILGVPAGEPEAPGGASGAVGI